MISSRKYIHDTSGKLRGWTRANQKYRVFFSREQVHPPTPLRSLLPKVVLINLSLLQQVPMDLGQNLSVFQRTGTPPPYSNFFFILTQCMQMQSRSLGYPSLQSYITCRKQILCVIVYWIFGITYYNYFLAINAAIHRKRVTVMIWDDKFGSSGLYAMQWYSDWPILLAEIWGMTAL
jgi:hypothetical protein